MEDWINLNITPIATPSSAANNIDHISERRCLIAKFKALLDLSYIASLSDHVLLHRVPGLLRGKE